MAFMVSSCTELMHGSECCQQLKVNVLCNDGNAMDAKLKWFIISVWNETVIVHDNKFVIHTSLRM